MMKDWVAVRDALGIKEEQRTVYKVEGRRARLTKDAAIREGLKALAEGLDGECDCSAPEPSVGYPGSDCGCHERREQMITRMTPLAKALPASQSEWERRIAQYREACFLDDGIWTGEGR